jgi:STE24 endopeptidase
MGLLLAPLIVLLAVHDGVRLLAPQWAASGGDAWVLFPMLALVWMLFPVLLRYVWHTRPLPPGPLRRRLQSLARQSGFETREILVWHTGGRVVNAAVAGFLRPLRYVFLSDGLLLQMSDEEVEAVFAHELGHLRHRHLWLRLLTVAAPLALWLLLEGGFPGVIDLAWQPLAAAGVGAIGMGTHAALALLLVSALAVYALVVFGYVARLLEHQADLFGCRLIGGEPGQQGDLPAGAVAAFSSALEKLAEACGKDRRRGGWQHGSIARRIEFLHNLCHRPNCELRFQRRVRRLGCLLLVIVVGPLVCRLLSG